MKQECELLQTVPNCIASDGSHGWVSMKCAVAMLPNSEPLFPVCMGMIGMMYPSGTKY